MASTTDSTLISKLESSESTGIYSLFSEYLNPFFELILPKNSNKSTISKEHKSFIRSLAKNFLSFLNRVLSILPKRLSEPSKFGGERYDQLAQEFFDVYGLCLDCLDVVSSQLACKPYSVHAQRVRMVHCFVAWGRYKDAEAECFRVLDSLKGIDVVAKSVKSQRWLLPDVKKWGGDKDFALLIVEIVVTLVKCTSLGQRKDSGDYRRVFSLLKEADPWVRILDANAYEKLHRVLVTHLQRCALFLVGELKYFDEDMCRDFYFKTMDEFAKSSMKDQRYKFAHRLCSSLFSLQENQSSLMSEILSYILDFLLDHELKDEVQSAGLEFVELIAFCANKCQKNTKICCTVRSCFNGIAGDLHQVTRHFQLLLRLYSIGLHLASINTSSRDVGVASFEALLKALLDEGEIQRLSPLLGSFGSYFDDRYKDKFVSSNVDFTGSVGQIRPQLDSHHWTFINWIQKDEESHLHLYLDALKFPCLLLAESIISEKKQIITQNESASVSDGLCHIQNTFYHTFDVFFLYERCSYQRGRDLDGNSLLAIAVASFILSIRTNIDMQESIHLFHRVISSEWIQPRGLKYLFASLHNIAIILYKNKQLNEASEALKLCCRASWTCIEMSVSKLKGSCDSNLSEDAIIDFVSESCRISAFLLDVLHQCHSHEMKRTIQESLESWSIAADIFEKLPGSMPLVKQWVKIVCKQYENVNGEDSISTLSSILSSSGKVSKRTLELLMEQELLAYEEFNALWPELCHKMKMKIIGYLLQDVYIRPESWLQKSRILVKKGMTLRLCGTQALRDCIQCLSEAISLIEVHEDKCTAEPCYELAVAYSFRALCTQEAEPNSKQVFQDITAALNQWLSIFTTDIFSADDKSFMASENFILLLYNIVDLLSIKGCVDFHHDIYRLMLRLFQWKNVPIEKYLAIFWECRRTSHALCISPINEAFITSLLEHHGEVSMSIDFWISCLKGSRQLLVSFQHTFSFLFVNLSRDFYNQEVPFQPDITIDEVKEVASQLISNVPVTGHCAFVAGYIFYDLTERLLSNGRLIEALSYAKEAYRLRTKIFQEKFTYSVEQQAESHCLCDMQIRRSVACEFWSFSGISWQLESCYLSPWNVLQCYLESILQVGIVNEIIGNGTEAESFFLLGRNIACSQSLPLFVVSFSSALGKLYCKKQLCDLAVKELQDAKKHLVVGGRCFSCLKCKLMLEATVDHHFGDLSRSIIDGVNVGISSQRLPDAKRSYESALEKLNHIDWKNPVSCPKEVSTRGLVLGKPRDKDVGCDVRRNAFPKCEETQPVSKKPSRARSKGKAEVKRCRKPRNAPKTMLENQDPLPEYNMRSTRSKSISSQNQCENGSDRIHVDHQKHLEITSADGCSGSFSHRDLLLEMKNCKIAIGCEERCVCSKMTCWLCLPMEVMNCGSVQSFIYLKWEYVRRKLSLKVLSSLACLKNHGEIHETHKIFWQSISTLVSRNAFCSKSSVPFSFLLDLFGKEISGDVFSIEHAELLCNLAWLSLYNHNSKDTRIICCGLSHIQLPKLVAWLMLAFVLCREVPILFQKVSRLLAFVFVLSASSEVYSFTPSSKALSENQWASYFHQASLGTNINYQLFTNNAGRYQVQHLANAEPSHVAGSTFVGVETCNSSRLAPESVQGLEEFVQNFFSSLPCTTIICISLLDGPYTSLLQELLLCPSSVHAWMLVSRLKSESQPLILLLPVDSILEEGLDDASSSCSNDISQNGDSIKQWKCPWGSTVVDDVAPEFRRILEENFLSSSSSTAEDTKRNRTLWWMWRKKLDHRLDRFLRNLEDSWLGPWKFLLLGEYSNHNHVNLINKKLVRDLKLKCKMNIDESILKVILGNHKYAFEDGGDISLQCLRNGCYVGSIGYNDKERGSISSDDANVVVPSGPAFKLICGAMDELLGENCADREPLVLVLDFEVQMLPWENIPILRNQEVYRMPSVASISATLDRIHQEQVGVIAASFPLIDPLDAFYLLNPSGDLSRLQIEFEEWFRGQNLEGKAGTAPTADELATALKSHDLFIYFGHGSGAQYIPSYVVQKLENCAATLLMGCSSGSLKLNGCYVPHGIPLSYLLAGSPAIVANLWEVTDKDIDRFGKAILDSWLKARLNSTADCAKCNLLVEKFEAMNIKSCNGNGRKKVARKNLTEACEKHTVKSHCDHRPKIGSFMGEAREACLLPFLIGAAPVCYGVPTGISRKKDL